MKERLTDLLRRIFDFWLRPDDGEDAGLIMNYMVPDLRDAPGGTRKGSKKSRNDEKSGELLP